MTTPDTVATKEDLIAAFVRGAQWWEWTSQGATMWPSDRNLAEEAARKWIELEYRTVL